MRDRTTWYRQLSHDLGRHWGGLPPELASVKPASFCQIELALRLLERLARDEPAEGAHALLSGYPFAHALEAVKTEQDETALAAARHLLWTMRRRRTWLQSLETYRLFPERLRAYEVPLGEPPVPLPLTVVANRLDVYDKALAALPPFIGDKLRLAPPGRSVFIEQRRPASVTIPRELCFARTPGHDLAAGRPEGGSVLTISRDELIATAQWMDQKEKEAEVPRPGNWEDRLSELRLAPRSADGKGFIEQGELRLNGLTHMAGMVGSGKSTLMTLVAVWAARQDPPLRTTLVVGDVAEQLRLGELFTALKIPAAVILGASTREDHVQRLHRRLAAQGKSNLLDHDDPRFDALSTACALDALRGTEAARPLRHADAPCTSLYPEASLDQDVPAGKRYGCPLWSRCPRHRSARDQVDAAVWIANPASLVQSAVPWHLNDERLRQLELACLRSAIIIVDEADAVQMRLDQLFAPSATLVQPGPDSWLDRLHTHKIEELSRRARLPLADIEIDQWNASLAVVSTATDRLYRVLISDRDLREWADTDYFSPWTMQEKLLADWFRERKGDEEAEGVPDERELFEAYENDLPEEEPPPQSVDARRADLTAIFDAFRDDPLGGHGPYGNATDGLIDLARDLLHTLSARETRSRTHALLKDLLEDTPAPVHNEIWREKTCRRLEFMLLLSVLHHRLDRLTYLWPQVEAALRLDATGNELARRPPLDYAPMIPESPMGNVLGFQFLPDERERDSDGRQSGTLRFFRCAGVGRELLLALPRIGTAPGRPGPHVVLMSGTSWAGTSTRAHVVAPVDVVLKPSERALEAIRRTTFTTRFLYNEDGQPLSLSGVPPKDRPTAARELASRLGRPGRGGTAGPLAQELNRIEDEQRRRALLLVSSYREADIVAETLHDIERWRGKVRVLVADDAEPGLPGAGPGVDSNGRARMVRRGDLAMFAEDRNAEVLVAPLMAIERGHNILNAQHNAAFGVALFLARPHPRPDDLSLAVFAVNDWAARFIRDLRRVDDLTGPATFGELVAKADDLDRAGLEFRHQARKEWRRLLSRRYIYSQLAGWERRSFAWDQLVVIWQVIGRLVRGGVPARVVFVDAKFAPKTAAALRPGETVTAPARDGLLADLHRILTPYFDDRADPAWFDDPADPALVRMLYAPMYQALSGLTHRT